MKITKSVRNMMMLELKKAFEKDVTLREFTEVFMFLDKWNTGTKVVPFNIYKNDEYLMLTDTPAGIVFNDWLDLKIRPIELNFNKGRKIVRQFKSISSSNPHSLAYTMPQADIFKIVVASLFVEYDERFIPFKFEVKDEKRFSQVMNKLRLYVSAIFFIDIVSGQEDVERLLALFINKPKNNLIDYVVAVGLYSETVKDRLRLDDNLKSL